MHNRMIKREKRRAKALFARQQRIPLGYETDLWGGDHCPGCNVPIGEYHIPGCDIE